MTDKLELAKSRAARAQALKNDDLLKEAFAELEREYLRAWKEDFNPRDTEARERMYHAVCVIGKVQQHLQTVIDGGKIAKQQIDDLIGVRKLNVV